MLAHQPEQEKRSRKSCSVRDEMRREEKRVRTWGLGGLDMSSSRIRVNLIR